MSQSGPDDGLAAGCDSGQCDCEATIRTNRTLSQAGGSIQMKAAIARRSFAPIFLVTAFAISAWTGPAAAQKSGGSITVGLELDIPGFDPLKVGVYDTVGGNRGRRHLRHTDHARRQGRAGSPSSRCPGAIPTTSRPGPSSCGPASNSTTARRSMRRPSRRISTGRRIPPTSAAARFILPASTDVQAPDELTLVYNLKDPAVNLPGGFLRPELRTLRFSRRRPGRPRATTTIAIPSAPVPIS